MHAQHVVASAAVPLARRPAATHLQALVTQPLPILDAELPQLRGGGQLGELRHAHIRGPPCQGHLLDARQAAHQRLQAAAPPDDAARVGWRGGARAEAVQGGAPVAAHQAGAARVGGAQAGRHFLRAAGRIEQPERRHRMRRPSQRHLNAATCS